MDKKPPGNIPPNKLKNERVDIYIGDLQKRLHQLRNKYDNIFVECCDILKSIQEVSTETITKQQEITRIIKEFEEIGMKNYSKDNGLKQALNQKAGEVKRLREKFESLFQNNLNEILHSQSSNYEVERNHMQYAKDTKNSSYEGGEIAKEESLYKMLNEPGRQDATHE